MLFEGCGTALVTPFRKDGSLDQHTLRALVKRQVEEGINFLVPCGTTGENPTLSREEHLRVVEITVEDSGPGIPPEAKERLFLPYFSTKRSGTGLGLAIVSRIIAEHHGSIRVEENFPTGTKFVIELPVDRALVANAEEALGA